jgi:hypothetical protein
VYGLPMSEEQKHAQMTEATRETTVGCRLEQLMWHSMDIPSGEVSAVRQWNQVCCGIVEAVPPNSVALSNYIMAKSAAMYILKL